MRRDEEKSDGYVLSYDRSKERSKRGSKARVQNSHQEDFIHQGCHYMTTSQEGIASKAVIQMLKMIVEAV